MLCVCWEWPKKKENNTKRTHHLAVNKVVNVKNTPQGLKLYVEYILTAPSEISHFSLGKAHILFNRSAHARKAQEQSFDYK